MLNVEFKEFAIAEHYQNRLIYLVKKMPVNLKYLFYLRRATFEKNRLLKWYYDRRLTSYGAHFNIEISPKCQIGKGLYLGHPGGITVNPAAVLGEYVCLHKGTTIGVENRGGNKGTPTIGNCVWIGINAIVIGNITIGDDVLISPNTVVNIDIPSHSVVYGNPCVVRHRDYATEGYISKKIWEKYCGSHE
jgi:serine O-acetyltransferase